jgi:hypothetical protein
MNKGNLPRMTVVTRGTAAGVVVLLAAAPMNWILADEADCKQPFEAMTRLYDTPSHQYLTETGAAGGDKPTTSEIINTGKAMYIKVDGKWHLSHATKAELQRQEEQNRKAAKTRSCRLVREESLDGSTVNFFNAHTETANGASDEQIWISKNDGRLVREIIDMTDSSGKSHAEIRVVYSGVETPSDVTP